MSCFQSAVLTILLVEPPQLDLVSFVLGLLLQPAGPGNRGEKEKSSVTLWNEETSVPVFSRSPRDPVTASAESHTGSCWAAMSGGCVSKACGRLTGNFPHPSTPPAAT